MYKTENEILRQYSALEETYKYLMERAGEIKDYYRKKSCKSVTFIGCGSSFSLCKSAALSLAMRSGTAANALPAGDLMLNFPHYENMMKDTLLIVPSRSGSTSEVILTVSKAKECFDAPCISICATRRSELSKISDLVLELPWAFDESVCQTRTVTNLYAANLILIGIITDNNLLLDEIKSAISNGDKLIKENMAALKTLAEDNSWDHVVTLGDSELAGIVEEGALAFKEICRLASNYFHVLDVRHGPSVLIGNKTLVIIATTPFGESYQKDLIRDLKERKAKVVVVSTAVDNPYDADHNFVVPSYNNYAVMGIPFIFIPQMLSYLRAVSAGINPDLPQGLNPWISL